jgi:acyl dehydratase
VLERIAMQEPFTIKQFEQVYFEDVEVGNELPSHIVSFNVVKMAMFASVSGDFFPSHYDNKWAIERSGHPAAIAHGLHISCHLSQLLTNWIGPKGALKRFSSENRGLTLDGDTVTMQGIVTKKYIQNGENLVDCDIHGVTQDGRLVISGSAVAILPSVIDK